MPDTEHTPTMQEVYDGFEGDEGEPFRVKRILLGDEGASAVFSQIVYDQGQLRGERLLRHRTEIIVYPNEERDGNSEFESSIASHRGGTIELRYKGCDSRKPSTFDIITGETDTVMSCGGELKIWEDGEHQRYVQFGHSNYDGVLVRVPPFEQALQNVVQGGAGVEIVRWGMMNLLTPTEEAALKALRVEDVWDMDMEETIEP